MNNIMKSKGFTMIEILIALVILSIAFLSLAGLMVQTTKNNSFGGRMTEAATFAQDKLEELRATPWGSMRMDKDTMDGSAGINYARNWTIEPDPVINPNASLRTITINIKWNDYHTDSWKNPTRYSISFISILSK